MPHNTTTRAASPQRDLPLPLMLVAMTIMLLAGGVLLDVDRVNGVRDTLDRVAGIAAIEAAAATTKPADRIHICQRRFARTVWTDTEVTLDGVEVSVDRDATGRTATVSYDATVKLAVGRYFGLDHVTISGETEVAAPDKQAGLTTP